MGTPPVPENPGAHGVFPEAPICTADTWWQACNPQLQQSSKSSYGVWSDLSQGMASAGKTADFDYIFLLKKHGGFLLVVDW